MKIVFITLLSISLLLESTIIAFPLTLILISVLSLNLGTRFIPYAFLSGVALDILSIRPIGSTSIIFLVFCYFIGRYKRKVPIGNLVYFLFFLTLGAVIYSLIFYRYVTYQNLFGAIIIGIILHEIFLKLTDTAFGGDKKLSVFEA